MSSTENGTTSVRPTAASSVLEKPVTRLPRTSGAPAESLTWRRAAGAWQTAATGFPWAMALSMTAMEWVSSARSHSGP